jgi:hypothetical protein
MDPVTAAYHDENGDAFNVMVRIHPPPDRVARETQEKGPDWDWFRRLYVDLVLVFSDACELQYAGLRSSPELKKIGVPFTV